MGGEFTYPKMVPLVLTTTIRGNRFGFSWMIKPPGKAIGIAIYFSRTTRKNTYGSKSAVRKDPDAWTMPTGQHPSFSRMRSEGFPFISGGLGVEGVFARSCFGVRNRSQPSATVRNRPQPSATVRGEAISVCHWDLSWKRVFDGSARAVFVDPVREP